MPDTSGETGDSSLPFYADPGDGRLWQRVERITCERRATGCEYDDDGLVLHARRYADRA